MVFKTDFVRIFLKNSLFCQNITGIRILASFSSSPSGPPRLNRTGFFIFLIPTSSDPADFSVRFGFGVRSELPNFSDFFQKRITLRIFTFSVNLWVHLSKYDISNKLKNVQKKYKFPKLYSFETIRKNSGFWFFGKKSDILYKMSYEMIIVDRLSFLLRNVLIEFTIGFQIITDHHGNDCSWKQLEYKTKVLSDFF